MEDPNSESTKEDTIVAAFDGKTSVVSCRNCGKVGDHWTRFCPYSVNGAVDLDDDDGESNPKVRK